MTEQAIFEQLRPLLVEVLGVPESSIKMESELVADLGAESIDLLDLSFRIEEHFKVAIEPNELEREARKRLPGGVYEKDGFLTEEAISALRTFLPEVDQGKLANRLRKADLPALLTVAFFVHLIQRKLNAKTSGASHA